MKNAEQKDPRSQAYEGRQDDLLSSQTIRQPATGKTHGDGRTRVEETKRIDPREAHIAGERRKRCTWP